MARKKSNMKWTPERLGELRVKVEALEPKLGKMKAIETVAKKEVGSFSSLRQKIFTKKNRKASKLKFSPKTTKPTQPIDALQTYAKALREEGRMEVISKLETFLKSLRS